MFCPKKRFNHHDVGWNYRYTNIQASLGLSQLKRVNKIIKKINGNYYYKHFKNLKILLFNPINFHIAEIYIGYLE